MHTNVCMCMYVLAWLLEKWVTYERTVSELLDWVMTEAEKFAKEVTTRGDKGVVDHIKSCEVSTYIWYGSKVRSIALTCDFLSTCKSFC